MSAPDRMPDRAPDRMPGMPDMLGNSCGSPQAGGAVAPAPDAAFTAFTHGGPDAAGPARWDFSSNANSAGPCPAAWQAVQAADATRYPDPGYHALRERLAAFHGVAASRIVVAGSGSEFIQRITAVSQRLRPGPVALPPQAYGDYARAALAQGRALVAADDPQASLRWCCDPGSPLGQDGPVPADPGAIPTVLDAVYAPLRLHGPGAWTAAARDAVFVLHSPNKALGLTGVRAAYAVAPQGAHWQPWLDALALAAPSWAAGAHGVALLEAWARPAVQDWLTASLDLLRTWQRSQLQLLRGLGVAVQPEPSTAPFCCAQLGVPAAALRPHGVQVRDAASFGLPGWARLNTLPPAAQGALSRALAAALAAERGAFAR